MVLKPAEDNSKSVISSWKWGDAADGWKSGGEKGRRGRWDYTCVYTWVLTVHGLPDAQQMPRGGTEKAGGVVSECE